MRGRNVVIAALAFSLGAVALVLGGPPAMERYRAVAVRISEHPQPRPATPQEQAAILRAVILEMRPHPASRAARERRPWKPVLMRRTFVLCPPPEEGVAFLRTCLDDPEALTVLSTDVNIDIPLVLRQELVAANARNGTNPDPRFDGVVVADRGDPAEASAQHVLRTTQAVLSRDGRHAVIAIGVHCGLLCGHSDLLYLAREGEDWVIEDRVMLSIS